MIDRHRAVTALRLTIFPLDPNRPPHAAELLDAIDEAWPSDVGRLSLNIVSETLIEDLMTAEPPSHLMIEVPAFMAVEPAHAEKLKALHKRGNTLLLLDRPRSPLPRDLLPCFAYSIIDVVDEQRDGRPPPGGVTRTIPHIQAGVTNAEQLQAAFERGAIAVLGWPMEPSATGSGKRGGQAGMHQIIELIRRVDRGDAPEKLEEVLRNDPTLAFRLMRFINSPYFGLSVEVSSFRHAIMLLGEEQLKRWLVLLLASATKDVNLKPLAYAAVRRGVLMEEFGGPDAGSDERTERFICGVFSLIDVMMGEPLERLLGSIPVSDTVRDALLHRRGPYQQSLELVTAVDHATNIFTIRSAVDAMLMSHQEVNRTILRALALARRIE
jgi:EAL and modified HD-GYP domain-containing signal transduction protein